MAGDDLQLRDVVPPEPLLPQPGMPPWALALLAVGIALGLATLFLAWRWRRRRAAPDAGPDPDKILAAARQRIEEARTLGRREAAVHLSTALRTYLAQVCRDPSLYETHQEFLGRHDALQAYPPELRDQVAATLTRLAEEKYDRPDPAAAGASWFEETRTLLDQLHQHPTA